MFNYSCHVTSASENVETLKGVAPTKKKSFS